MILLLCCSGLLLVLKLHRGVTGVAGQLPQPACANCSNGSKYLGGILLVACEKGEGKRLLGNKKSCLP